MRYNINKYFKFKIKSKLIIAFAALSILPMLIVGILGISSNVKSLHEIGIKNLKSDLSGIQKELDIFFHGIEENVHFLTSTSAFLHFVNAINANDSLELKNAKTELFPEILTFTKHKKLFYQLRFISGDGEEWLVVNHIDGSYRILPEEELNQTCSRFYIYLAEEIQPNTAVFVPTELKKYNSDELIPTISCVFHVRKPNFFGILVFQIYAESFFKIVDLEGANTPEGKVMLVNYEGYYTYHSDKKTNWNQLSASKEISNLKVELGEEIAQEILSESAKQIYDLDSIIIAQAKVFTSEIGIDNEYTLLLSVSDEIIFASVKKHKTLFWALLFIFLVISILLGLRGTQEFTEPIKKLINESKIIAKGDYRSRVVIETYDELEELAQQFNLMAESLEQREKELVMYQEELEKKVHDRTAELETEKNKLQIILDNVPSGFVLINKDCEILSASAAMQEITGQKVDNLIGKPCLELVQHNKEAHHELIRKVFNRGNIETIIEIQESVDGEERFYEYILVPLKKQKVVNSVLEIITDITKRKRLQDMLIRSEKLATTGEIAAVIAHEMRNSLTSVRMILQLLSRREQNDSDKESFQVALDSVSRMENIVNNLLQIARPAKLEKKTEEINNVLKYSIEFARHQIINEKIDLEINLAKNLPRMLIDRDQIREAFINLLLNASQAIESSGKIKIMSQLTILKKELHDFKDVYLSDSDLSHVDVTEMIIKKGAKVVQIDISDEGKGISKDELNRIFDPFYTTKINGTGLGLSLVKRVINLHGGIVTVKSLLKKGTRFSILLPVDNSM